MTKLRLRLKVYIDKAGVRWLVPSAQTTKRRGYLHAIGMRDGGEDHSVTSLVFTPAQWNTLPFFWFEEREAAAERPRSIVPEELRELFE